jgi:hypothetical protein
MRRAHPRGNVDRRTRLSVTLPPTTVAAPVTSPSIEPPPPQTPPSDVEESPEERARVEAEIFRAQSRRVEPEGMHLSAEEEAFSPLAAEFAEAWNAELHRKRTGDF